MDEPTATPHEDQSPSIIVIGNWEDAEFAAARDWLTAHYPCRHYRRMEQAQLALQQSGAEPVAIVLVQSQPGQFSTDTLSHWQSRFPFTLTVVLYGSWCEGETRSGFPVASSERVAWYQAADRFPALFQSAARLPMTVADEEKWHWSLNQTRPTRQRRVGVCCAASDQQDTWMDGLKQFGYQPVRVVDWQSASHCDVIIWDDVASTRGHRVPLSTITGQFADGNRPTQPSPPVVAMLTFPRTQDESKRMAEGAAAVMSKPYQWTDVIHCLERFVSADA